jgi:hypothetical protein
MPANASVVSCFAPLVLFYLSDASAPHHRHVRRRHSKATQAGLPRREVCIPASITDPAAPRSGAQLPHRRVLGLDDVEGVMSGYQLGVPHRRGAVVRTPRLYRLGCIWVLIDTQRIYGAGVLQRRYPVFVEPAKCAV